MQEQNLDRINTDPVELELPTIKSISNSCYSAIQLVPLNPLRNTYILYLSRSKLYIQEKVLFKGFLNVILTISKLFSLFITLQIGWLVYYICIGDAMYSQ